MNKQRFRKQLLGLVFLTVLFTSSNIILTSALVETMFPQITTNDTDIFVEDFEDTTFKSPSTNAYGWGTGTVTNARNVSLIPLDFYPTKNPLRGIEVQGRKAYAVGYNSTSAIETLLAFNINDPVEIHLASYRSSLTELYSLAVSGDTLYGGTLRTERINYYNITYPYDLGALNVFMGSSSTNGAVTDIEIQGNLLYLAIFKEASSRSFKIVDVTNPAPPNTLISTNFNSANVLGLAVAGHYAYLAASSDGLYVLNVTDKYAPAVLGHLNLPGNATDVILDGRFAYVSLAEEGVALVDIHNPTNPQLIDVCFTDGIATRMALQGNTLFVANGPGGIVILDVADYNKITYLFRHMLPYVWDVDLYGGTVVVGTDEGLHTLQICATGGGITNIAKTVYPNTFTDLEAWDVKVIGDIAYVAGGPDGIYTLDVRDPNHPILLDHLPTNPNVVLRRLDVQGQFAIAVSNYSIQIFDIQNPTNIKNISKIGGNSLYDVFIDGSFLYITWQLGGFAIFNLTTASMLSWLNELDEPHFGTNITALWAQGYRIYAVDYSGLAQSSFFIFDRLDPTNIHQTDEASLWGLNLDLKVDGDIAYHSDTNWCVVSNVSDPTDRQFITDLRNDTGDYIKSTAVWNFGPYVLTASPSGAYLVNAITPWAPTSTMYPYTQGALAITTSGDYTYIANRTSLIILRHFESAADTYVDEINQAESTTIFAIPNGTISAATLDFNAWVPEDCSIEFFMSADGGLHWEAATPGMWLNFTNTGRDLRWRAVIDGNTDRSVHLYQVVISFTFEYERPPWYASPLWIGILAGGGGGLLLIILIIVIAVSVSKKKKANVR